MEQNVFVYGSLMFPQVYEGVTGCSREMQEATLPDFRRYAVKDPSRSDFPGMVQEEGAAVVGKLIRDVSSAELDLLDKFEEVESDLYRRIPVTVQIGDADADAFAYVAGPGIRSYLEGEWDPQNFAATKLPSYMDLVVEPFKQEQIDSTAKRDSLVQE